MSLQTAPSRAPRRFVVALMVTLVAALTLGHAPPAHADRFTPKPGVTVSYPLSKKKSDKRAILAQVIRSVGSARRGSIIRVASWNIRGRVFVDALIAAHDRGVTVRVVMDRNNAYPGAPNPGVNRLQDELSRHNRGRSADMRSGLTKCRSSCRGTTGNAHSKFFLFSATGKARDVVVNSSFNATDLAASIQWNDAYTFVGDAPIYDAFATVFDQMYLDQPIAQPFFSATSGGSSVEFFPYHGPGTDGDPVLKDLDRVTCRGAANTSSGRTKIRIAISAWHGDRGIRIARKVRALSAEGCDIRVVYAVGGHDVRRLLRAPGKGHVPSRHIAQDFNRDGVYDRYLHSKVLTVKGVYGDDPGATLVVSGSANWTSLALASDEAIIRLTDAPTLAAYNRYIDRVFDNPPPQRRGGNGVAERRAVAAGIDPYANVEVD